MLGELGRPSHWTQGVSAEDLQELERVSKESLESTEEWKNLAVILKSKGLKIVETPADGSCLFAGFSIGLKQATGIVN